MDEELLSDFDTFSEPTPSPTTEQPIGTAQALQEAAMVSPIEPTQEPIQEPTAIEQDPILSDFDTFSETTQPQVAPIEQHRPEGMDDTLWEDIKSRAEAIIKANPYYQMATSAAGSARSLYGEVTGEEGSTTGEALKAKAQLENIEFSYSDLAETFKSVTGDKEAQARLADKQNKLNSEVVSILSDRGIESYSDKGEIYVVAKDKDGNDELKSLSDEGFATTFLKDLEAGAMELGGSVAGTVSAVAAGQRMLPPQTPPQARAAVALGTGAIGAYTGTALGRATDIIRNSISLNRKIDAKKTFEKATEAGVADVIAGGVVAGAVKTVGAVAKPIAKASQRLKTLMKEGNIEGAKRVVKEDYGVTDKQIDEAYEELTKDVETVKDLKGDDLLRAKLEAVVQMQPQGKALITAAIRKSPKAAIETSREIASRAKEVIKATERFSKNPSGIKKSVEAYEKVVGKNYGEVRDMIDEALPNYKPDLDMGTFKTTLNDLNTRVIDPDVKDRITNLADSLASQKSESIGDLINIRQLFNKFYGKNKGHFESKMDKEALLSIQKTIDSKIDDAIGTVGEEGTAKALKNAFKDAKSKYADMFKTQDTATYKAIFKQGASEEDIGKALVKYSKATDNDLGTVLSKLSPVQRVKGEFSIIKQMVNKATAKGEAQAINFRALLDDIKTSSKTFKTPEAKQFIKNIESYDKKFGKDVDIQAIAAGVAPKQESNIATSFIGKIMMKISSLRFEALQRMMPTEQGRRLSLQKSIESALEKSRTPKEFFFNASKIKGMPNTDRQALKSAIKEIGEQESKLKQSIIVEKDRVNKEAIKQTELEKTQKAIEAKKARMETQARADKAILTKKEFMEKKKLSSQAKLAQEAKQIPIGGSEDQAKQAVKNVFAKKQQDPYKNMTDADLKEIDRLAKEDKETTKITKAIEEEMPKDISGNSMFASFGPELFTGSISGIDYNEETGAFTFDTKKFMAGFLGGHIAKKIATNPKLSVKAKKEVLAYAQRLHDKLDGTPMYQYVTGIQKVVDDKGAKPTQTFRNSSLTENKIFIIKPNETFKGEMTLLKNKEKAPNMGNRFGQDVEPTGYFAIQKETRHLDKMPNYETVKADIKNPLIIDVTDDLIKWKRDLSEKYSSKTKRLTNKLIKEGYDSIITTTKTGELGEIIILDTSIIKKANND